MQEDLRPYMENKAVQEMIESAGSKEGVLRKIFSTTRVTPEFAQTKDGGEEYDWGGGLVHTAVQDPETKLEYMDEFDIDYSMLTPGICLSLASVNHDQTAVEIASAYNKWMAETFYDASERLKSAILVATQRPAEAAEEIDKWADEDGAAAVQLPASGLVPPAGHSWYDPIFEAAEKNGLPILMHTGNSATTSVFPVQRRWSETFTEDHLFTFPVEGMWHLNSMLFQGVPERFPDLEFVMQETGVEWLPWMMWRMDDHYLQNSEDVPVLERLPSEYIKEQFYFTTQPLGHTDNPSHMGKMLEMAGGSDTILFATDHPHPDFDTTDELFVPLRANGDFGGADLEAMMGETAIELFDLA
jgi:predicted TIM-barrel fold metal-dependent hydrolase